MAFELSLGAEPGQRVTAILDANTPVVVVGRKRGSGLTTIDRSVSREHAEICPDDDGFVLTDLGSTNGTTVNGVDITSRRLDDGDIVSLGATTSFEFRAG